jgi:hypothetical protein
VSARTSSSSWSSIVSRLRTRTPSVGLCASKPSSRACGKKARSGLRMVAMLESASGPPRSSAARRCATNWLTSRGETSTSLRFSPMNGMTHRCPASASCRASRRPSDPLLRIFVHAAHHLVKQAPAILQGSARANGRERGCSPRSAASCPHSGDGAPKPCVRRLA